MLQPLTVYAVDLPERNTSGNYVPFAATFAMLEAEVALQDSGAEVIGIQEKLLSTDAQFGVIRSMRAEIRWTNGQAQDGKATTAVTAVVNQQALLGARIQAISVREQKI